ncbi:MAG: HemK2/MTQ2 family protein methyltransferase [Halolamina sp.]
MTDDESAGRRDGGDTPSLADQRGVETAVYQPAEDSGLLAAAAVDHVAGADTVLEVGTGSGWVAERVAAETDARVVGGDVNPHATRQAAARDGVAAIRADLTRPVRADAVDAVVFNPPYLPTDPDHEWDDWMETALSGGESGRELIAPFLDDVSRVLAPGGCVLLLVSSLAGYDAVVDLAAAAGFDHEVVRQESFPFETLSILKLTPAT